MTSMVNGQRGWTYIVIAYPAPGQQMTLCFQNRQAGSRRCQVKRPSTDLVAAVHLDKDKYGHVYPNSVR